MPLLPKEGYNAQVGGLPQNGGRRAEMESPVAAATHELGRTAQAVGEKLLSFTEEEESRKALVASSQIRADYAQKLDAAANSGEDLAPIKEKMNEALSNVGAEFQTRKGTQSLQLYTSNTNLMFDEQANHIEGQRAFANAKLDAHKLINSSSAIIASNPGYLKVAEENVDALVSTFGKIRADQRVMIADEMKKELNLSAAVSAARSDPRGTTKKLQDGEWNLTPAQREHALNRADTEFRSQEAEQSRIEALAQKRIVKQDNDARDQHFKGIMDGTGGMRRAIMDDPRLRPQTREHLIVFMKQWADSVKNGEKKSDPVVLKNLWLDINAPENDPRKIYNGDKIFAAVEAGTVNPTDADRLNTAVGNQRDENNRTIGQKTATLTSIVGRALSQDPKFTAQPALVAEIQNDYIDRVNQKIKDLRDAGDKKPNRIFEVADKDYVGSREFIQGAIDSGMQRQRAATTAKMPKVTTQDEYNALQPGTVYLDSAGNQATKRGKAVIAPAAAGPKAPEYEGFIKTKPRSSSVEIDAPVRSAARKLQGQTFESREAALNALKALYE